MTHVLRCRITAHHTQDRAYDGSAKDFARVLAEHEATVAELKATGADVILEDARPVNVRKAAITEPLVPEVKPAVEMPMVETDGADINPKTNPLDIPDFMKRKA